jgi:hypothetical protein
MILVRIRAHGCGDAAERLGIPVWAGGCADAALAALAIEGGTHKVADRRGISEGAGGCANGALAAPIFNDGRYRAERRGIPVRPA